jgi:hypothetical protein
MAREYFYRDVPGLGHVAVSRHAQDRMDAEQISDAAFQRVLFDGTAIQEGADVMWKERDGIRAVILLNPTPNRGARLVKTVFRIQGQLSAK